MTTDADVSDQTARSHDTSEAARQVPTSQGHWWRGTIALVPSIFIMVLWGFSFLANWLSLAELVNSLQLHIFWGLVGSAVWLVTVRPRCEKGRVNGDAQRRPPCARKRAIDGYSAWMIAVALAAVVCGVRVFGVYWPVRQPPSGQQMLRVMTFNVLGTNDDLLEIIDAVRRESPDVLMVWELTYATAKQLEVLRDEFPIGMDRPHYFFTLGFGVYSKHPFTFQRITWLPDRMLSCPIPELRLEFAGQQIRILGIHASNPIFSHKWPARNRQLEALADMVLADARPTIVMGDFNATPWSPNLRRFLRKTGLRDTRQGQGLHNSWPAPFLWFGVPIDHVFVSKEFHLHRRRLGQALGSDHAPIICDLSMAERP